MTQATDRAAGWNRDTQQNPPEATEAGSAVARRAEVAVGLPIHNLDEAFRMANALSHSALVPRDLRGKGPDILAVLLYGAELGLSVWQSIQGINVIEGRPSMSAELRVSKTRERGHKVAIVCRTCGEFAEHHVHVLGAAGGHRFAPDWDDTRCTVRAVRHDTGETAEVTWTAEQAVAAGLLTRAPDGSLKARSANGRALPWELYTRDMLYARASSRAAKLVAPEVGYGTYTPEETEEIVAAERAAAAQPVVCGSCGKTGHAREECPDIIDGEVDPGEVRATVAGLAEEYAGSSGADDV